MTLEYIRYTIDAVRQGQFVYDYKRASIPLLRSEYCKKFEISRCVEDQSQFIVRIVWTSTRDHLDKFRKSIEFKEFFVIIKPYVGDIAEMRHYEVL